MVIANSPSKLSLPQKNPGVTTVLEFLICKFPAISPNVWQQRMAAGKVHWHDGSLINEHSLFVPQQRVYYYREVACETVIPFSERVVFQDELILVAYKPHFLPVTPGGRFIAQCLQSRLRISSGNQQLQAVHRIDRATAGLVLFSVNPSSRQLYHGLFETQQVSKTYQAVASTFNNPVMREQQWEVKSRLQKSEPKFLMQTVEGITNSHSRIRCLKRSAGQALFELNPITGKTHQLRVHMQSIGLPLLNDTYYPTLQLNKPDDYSKPLQLLAQQLQFIDPITKQDRRFISETELSLN